MTGKEKCNFLRRIREKIARKIGLNISQEPCTYEGPCSGTCPKCDQEAQQLNAQLSKLTNPEQDIRISEMERRKAAMERRKAIEEWQRERERHSTMGILVDPDNLQEEIQYVDGQDLENIIEKIEVLRFTEEFRKRVMEETVEESDEADETQPE